MALAYVHRSDEIRLKPIYTDTNLCDPNLWQVIEQFVEEINRLRDISSPLPEDWELVLELGKDDETGEPICLYYFVRHSTRCLFWLHEFDLEDVLAGLCGVTEMSHIRESVHILAIYRTKHTTRPGITVPILVSCCPRLRQIYG